MGQPAKRHIRSGTRETFGARQLNRRHSQPFDVPRVTDRAHGNPIVNFENLLSRTSEREKQDPAGITQCRNRAARRQLRLDIFATVGDRFDPAIWLFDHATDSLKMLSILSSRRVLIPSL